VPFDILWESGAIATVAVLEFGRIVGKEAPYRDLVAGALAPAFTTLWATPRVNATTCRTARIAKYP